MTAHATPVVFESGLHAREVVNLMDELIAWWPRRTPGHAGGVGVNGGTSHLRWVRDTFAAAEVVAPPKPEEPTSLGAVVEDAEGHLYIRTADTDCAKPWSYANNYSDHDYASIAAVKVLSGGVTS